METRLHPCYGESAVWVSSQCDVLTNEFSTLRLTARQKPSAIVRITLNARGCLMNRTCRSPRADGPVRGDLGGQLGRDGGRVVVAIPGASAHRKPDADRAAAAVGRGQARTLTPALAPTSDAMAAGMRSALGRAATTVA